MNELPRARGPLAIDSAGFTELSLYGEWTVTMKEYARQVRRFVDCIGNVRWAASADWMCEPAILAKTGKTVREHQLRTLLQYVELLNHDPDLPWAPVLQGWTIGEYWDHLEDYDRAGVDLKKAPAVGVGTLCRRQQTTRATALLATLKADGLDNLHGFGWKLRGLVASKDFLASADSLAWSSNARKHPPLPGCSHEHCNNCLKWALRWRARVLSLLGQQPEPPRDEGPVQQHLF